MTVTILDYIGLSMEHYADNNNRTLLVVKRCLVKISRQILFLILILLTDVAISLLWAQSISRAELLVPGLNLHSSQFVSKVLEFVEHEIKKIAAAWD